MQQVDRLSRAFFSLHSMAVLSFAQGPRWALAGPGLWQLSASNAELVAYSEFDGDAALAGHLHQTYMRNLAGFLQVVPAPPRAQPASGAASLLF